MIVNFEDTAYSRNIQQYEVDNNYLLCTICMIEFVWYVHFVF